MNDGDNVFGKAAEPTQTILAQGLNVANLECETDTPDYRGWLRPECAPACADCRCA